jgi:hypothetical protein
MGWGQLKNQPSWQSLKNNKQLVFRLDGSPTHTRAKHTNRTNPNNNILHVLHLKPHNNDIMRWNNGLTKVKKLLTNMISWKHMREVARLLLTYVPKLIHLKRRDDKSRNTHKKSNSKKGAKVFSKSSILVVVVMFFCARQGPGCWLCRKY